MFVVGIPHRPTGHGMCGLHFFLPLINDLAELPSGSDLGLLRPTNPFRLNTSPPARAPDVARR